MPSSRSAALENCRVPTRLKLSALWTSLMFCYVYGDYFGMYVPGKIMQMKAGEMSFGSVTPTTLTVVAAMMAIPALMVALSLLLPAPFLRWLCIGLGLAYTAIMALTMIGGAPLFYLVLGAIEIALSLAIVAIASRWPRDIMASA